MINLCHKRKSEVILHTRRYIEQASLRSKVKKSGVDRKKILAKKRGLHDLQKSDSFLIWTKSRNFYGINDPLKRPSLSHPTPLKPKQGLKGKEWRQDHWEDHRM